MYKKRPLFISISVGLAITACATIEKKMIEQSATRLNAEQVKSHTVGHTERWSKGGAYYSPDGTLETVWEGSSERGPYAITESGTVCYDVEGWKRHCHFYMDDGGAITMIYQGKNAGVREVPKDNQLSVFQANSKRGFQHVNFI